MGKPTCQKASIVTNTKRTGRSETSQYPEEKTSNEIPPVAASERGGADEFRRRGITWKGES